MWICSKCGATGSPNYHTCPPPDTTEQFTEFIVELMAVMKLAPKGCQVKTELDIDGIQFDVSYTPR